MGTLSQNKDAKEVFDFMESGLSKTGDRLKRLEQTAASPRLLKADTTQIVIGTSGLMTLFSQPLFGGSIQTKNLVEIYALCLTLNSSGASENISFFVSYGVSSIQLGPIAFANAATRRLVEIHAWLKGVGSESSQRLIGKIDVSAPITTFGAPVTSSGNTADLAIDSSQDQDIKVEVQHTTTSGSIITTGELFLVGAPIAVP